MNARKVPFTFTYLGHSAPLLKTAEKGVVDLHLKCHFSNEDRSDMTALIDSIRAVGLMLWGTSDIKTEIIETLRAELARLEGENALLRKQLPLEKKGG